MHAQLSADFGTLPEAVSSKHWLQFSKGEVGGIEIEHSFDENEHVGLTEMITFRKKHESKG